MADLATKPQFVNVDSYYQANHLRQPFLDRLEPGVTETNDYLVVPNGGSAANPDAAPGSQNRTVTVLGPGVAYVPDNSSNQRTGGLWRQYMTETSVTSLTVATNSSGSTRVDIVYLEVDEAGQKGILGVQQGTAGAGTPTLANNRISLATLSLASGYASISGAMITDTRVRAAANVVSKVLQSTVTATQSTNTLVQSIAFTLYRPRRVLLAASARAINNGASEGLIGMTLLDNGSIISGAQTGLLDIASGKRLSLDIVWPVELAVGAHTIRQEVDRDGSGAVDITGAAQTINSRSYRSTTLSATTL